MFEDLITQHRNTTPHLTLTGMKGIYIHRWHLAPRGDDASMYLHHIVGDDDDRALHDHPYDNISYIIQGGYWEIVPHPILDDPQAWARHWRTAGDTIKRKATDAHRLLWAPDQDTWTLFITGPRIREWGFLCEKGWVHWKDFTGADYTQGGVMAAGGGPGCGD